MIESRLESFFIYERMHIWDALLCGKLTVKKWLFRNAQWPSAYRDFSISTSIWLIAKNLSKYSQSQHTSLSLSIECSYFKILRMHNVQNYCWGKKCEKIMANLATLQKSFFLLLWQSLSEQKIIPCTACIVNLKIIACRWDYFHPWT